MNAPGRPVRRGRKQRPGDSQPSQIDWRDIRNHMAPLAPLSADQIEAVHLASLRLLEEYGIEVMSERARDVYRRAGAEVALLHRCPKRSVPTPQNNLLDINHTYVR